MFQKIVVNNNEVVRDDNEVVWDINELLGGENDNTHYFRGSLGISIVFHCNLIYRICHASMYRL